MPITHIEIAPGLRKMVLEKLMDALYLNTSRYNEERLQGIVRRNSKALHNSQLCFTFKGENFCAATHEGRYPRPMNALQPFLKDEMKEFIEEREKQYREAQYLRGYILNVFSVSDQAADYYKLLPFPLHGVIRKFAVHFAPGEGMLLPDGIEQFLQQNDKYVTMLKTRVTFNLIGF